MLLAIVTVSVGKLIVGLLIAFIVGLLIGSQTTSHAERVHDCNLEDAELAELGKIERYASTTGKAAL